MNLKNEIDRATKLGQRLEDLVVQRKECPADTRNLLLMTYWSLIFDFDKGVLALLRNGYYGSAFALFRPMVEAVIRAHLVLSCTDEQLVRIQNDTYRVNFSTVGREIDSFFGMHGLFETFLGESTKLLHSFTHSGLAQLARRIDGSDIAPHYDRKELESLINIASSAVFMVTILVTKHFKFEPEWQSANDIFVEQAMQ